MKIRECFHGRVMDEINFKKIAKFNWDRAGLAVIFCTSLLGMDARMSYALPIYSDQTSLSSVEDGADILDNEEEASLLDLAAEISQETGWEIRLLTTRKADYGETQQYAMDYFVSLTGDDDSSGACYIIDMYNREYDVVTTGDMRYYVTDERVEMMLDDAQEDMSDGSYADAFFVMLDDTLEDYLAGVPSGANIYDPQTGQIEYYVPEKRVTLFEAIVSIFISLAAFFAVFLAVRLSYNMVFAYKDEYSFRDNVRLRLDRREDTLTGRHVTRRRIPRPRGPGGPGGHGPGHGGGFNTSTTIGHSGGHSFGGGGRKF